MFAGNSIGLVAWEYVSLIERLGFACKMVGRHFGQLRQYVRNHKWHKQQVTSITGAWLGQQHITVLALDFDGVLAPHGRLLPLPKVVSWLRQLVSEFPENCIYIYTNKPLPERQQWFAANFPSMHFVQNVRKKPYPDGLDQIMTISGAKPEAIALVDDRLLTGILATIIAGAKGVWIKRPYHNLSYIKQWPYELVFMCLRGIEKFIFSF